MSDKNKKEFANDLKTIYHAPSEDAALEQLERVTEKWEGDYPNAMKSWYKKWTLPLRNWGRVLGELEIMYPDRLSRLTAEET